MREVLQEQLPAGVSSYHPIGHIHSCFGNRRGTPRQGKTVEYLFVHKINSVNRARLHIDRLHCPECGGRTKVGAMDSI